jgi:hypothetical protein
VVRVLAAEQPRRQVSLFTRRAGDLVPHMRTVMASFTSS